MRDDCVLDIRNGGKWRLIADAGAGASDFVGHADARLVGGKVFGITRNQQVRMHLSRRPDDGVR
jgi:hypothetical protein